MRNTPKTLGGLSSIKRRPRRRAGRHIIHPAQMPWLIIEMRRGLRARYPVSSLRRNLSIGPYGTGPAQGSTKICMIACFVLYVLTSPCNSAWVHTLHGDEEELIAAAQSMPLVPPELQIAQHNNTPAAKHVFKPDTSRGRLYDHQRESTPLIPHSTVGETRSRWKAFAEASAYPAISAGGGEIVTEEWLVQNGADYSRPWLAGDDENGDPEKNPMRMFRAKRRAWYVRAQRTVLRNPIVPMVIRMNVWVFSAVALGLAGSIHHLTDRDPSVNSTPSTDMAIIVDVIAMVYLLYITYDEYSGKPLGLRPARAKMRLIFLDLFFIVFDSANLSLAFEAIRSESCNADSRNKNEFYTSLTSQICSRQKGLASVLLIALIAWLLTFAISVLR